jgi:glycosyltransferase involved in cell wall biosynthesis
MTAAAKRVAFNGAMFAWAVRASERELRRARHESAARWALVAAQLAAAFPISRLASPELESILARASVATASENIRTYSPARRWLHVLSEAGVGGHTMLAKRWIELDSSDDVHYLALTFQTSLEVAALEGAIQSRGGSVFALGHIGDLTARAMRLRELAFERADIVVLHVHPWDVVAPLAFDRSGGPPVVLLNHADHAFWIGTAAADAVINLRPSGEHYARDYRGIVRNLRLSIPLTTECSREAVATYRAEKRRSLQLPSDAVVILTIGLEEKYQPVDDLNFFAAANTILAANSRVHLLAVGPRSHVAGWKELRDRYGSRVLAVGYQHDLVGYHAAADLYVEGFPFGSLTALLEAAAAGLPVVRAPKSAPPPFTSDGDALDEVPQADSVVAFVDECVRLLQDPGQLPVLGRALQSRVRAIHEPTGWRASLAALRGALPVTHRVPAANELLAVPTSTMERWAAFRAAIKDSEPVWFAKGLAEQLGLRAHCDHQLSSQLANREELGRLYPVGRIASLYPWPIAPLATAAKRWFFASSAKGSR